MIPRCFADAMSVFVSASVIMIVKIMVTLVEMDGGWVCEKSVAMTNLQKQLLAQSLLLRDLQ